MGGDENDAAVGNVARSQGMAARTRRTAAAADGGDRMGHVDMFCYILTPTLASSVGTGMTR